MAFLAGGYTATWNALAVGQTANGFKLSREFFMRMITGDTYGDAPQDAVYRGAQMSGDFTLIEANAAAAQTLAWPFSATNYDMGVVGRTAVGSAIAKSLVMTAIAGTPAAALPATQTHLTTLLKEGYPVELLYAADLREVPIRLRIFPNSSGVFGTAT